jgi:hypothetical protein
MAQNDLVQPIEEAATSQVKLCLCDEEDSHIWFRLIKAEFAAAGIRSQRLKYANALASLPKQVLRDILDTVDVCNDSNQPFDHLKEVLLGQFGKSNWLALSPPGNARPQSKRSHGETQTASPSRSHAHAQPTHGLVELYWF